MDGWTPQCILTLAASAANHRGPWWLPTKCTISEPPKNLLGTADVGSADGPPTVSSSKPSPPLLHLVSLSACLPPTQTVGTPERWLARRPAYLRWMKQAVGEAPEHARHRKWVPSVQSTVCYPEHCEQRWAERLCSSLKLASVCATQQEHSCFWEASGHYGCSAANSECAQRGLEPGLLSHLSLAQPELAGQSWERHFAMTVGDGACPVRRRAQCQSACAEVMVGPHPCRASVVPLFWVVPMPGG